MKELMHMRELKSTYVWSLKLGKWGKQANKKGWEIKTFRPLSGAQGGVVVGSVPFEAPDARFNQVIPLSDSPSLNIFFAFVSLWDVVRPPSWAQYEDHRVGNVSGLWSICHTADFQWRVAATAIPQKWLLRLTSKHVGSSFCNPGKQQLGSNRRNNTACTT